MTMKKRIALIIVILIIALVICVLTWRFWPQSFSNLMGVDEGATTGISAYAMESTFENGQSDLDMYRIDIEESQSDEITELIEILSTSHYQQDFRNLFLWGLDYVDSDRNYDGKTISLSLYAGPQQDEYVEIQFLSSSIVAVRGSGKSGLRIYHPTNRETMGKLIEYLQTHGEQSTIE